MNRVFLLRHAKSSWDTPGLPDHERPLAPRGVRDLAALRQYVATTGISPELVLCSTARRAADTWDGIASACPHTSVELTDDLYGATAGDLLRRLRQLPEAIESILLVGHNPGLEDLALGLVGSGDVQLRRRLETKFPTGALATLALAGPWSNLRWDAAELADFVVPRQLRAA